MVEMLVTEEEKELIETIRNYRNAYPNGEKMMEIEIDEMLSSLMKK